MGWLRFSNIFASVKKIFPLHPICFEKFFYGNNASLKTCFVCEQVQTTAYFFLLDDFIWLATNLQEMKIYLEKYKSSHPEVFLGKSFLKICSKFTGEHSCRSAILAFVTLWQLNWNHISAWVFSSKFVAYFQNTFF